MIQSSVTVDAIQSSIITGGSLAVTKLDSTGTAPSFTTEVWLDSAACEFQPLRWGFPDLVMWVPGQVGCSWKGLSVEAHFRLGNWLHSQELPELWMSGWYLRGGDNEDVHYFWLLLPCLSKGYKNNERSHRGDAVSLGGILQGL